MKKYHGLKTLARHYALKHGVSIKKAEEIIKSVVDVIEYGLYDDYYDGVQFINSFTLKRVLRKSRLGRNPLTNEEVIVPPRVGIKTELGKDLSLRLARNTPS